MSDIMRLIPFSKLMERIFSEYKNEGTVFGVSRIVKYTDGSARPIFKERIESPFGPAAGPNTQLAQNIIVSYLCGARFFELKTVQIMDGEELSACVNKPCITAHDECYNCEWSTELTVPQAYEEYVKAWVACKILAKEWGLGDPDAFVFNMSVGYDLEGIRSAKIDKYIEEMKEAKDTEIFKECIEWALAHVDGFDHVDADYIKGISSKISDSITESTLHGCPPDEIERIASYLITEKGLNTYIKCNPTLLGYDYARERLDSLGFSYIAFDDHHFKEDLQWADAVPMFNRLIKLSADNDKEFGVKLTNTFPVDVKANELPSEEMYMSGRSLYTLTTELARRITEEFSGKLRISYSGGADAFNIKGLYDAGIWPVTMATTLLKPGGYERFSQIADVLGDTGSKPFEGVDLKAVTAIVEAVKDDPRYQKGIKPLPKRHMDKKVPLIDCFEAPCREGCPIHQDIPAYLNAMKEGRAKDALNIIISRNALPFTTGTICPHTCGNKCMRNHYEDALHIREVKLLAAKEAFDEVIGEISSNAGTADKNIAVIGAGPAGLSAAFFLTRAGAKVTVFEKTGCAGGVVKHVIPSFRIGDDVLEKDIELCSAYGVTFEYNRNIDNPAALLKEGFSEVVIATGAWAHGKSPLNYGEALDALSFLQTIKEGDPDKELSPGADVVVIGGGNTAMDTARAAKRLKGVKNVRLVYRRDRRNMPADEEELEEALKDGVEFMELLAPIGVKDGSLTCSVMELGAPDESGRRAPVDTGRQTEVPASCVIAAVGEQTDKAPFEAAGISMDGKGHPVLSECLETSVKGIYAIGDCKAGPATVVKAIADAQKIASAITGISFDGCTDKNILDDTGKALETHGMLCESGSPDGRCLNCATVCETCAEVCPNRANVAIRVEGMSFRQIIHVDGMCNECGNCAVFCPYDSAPYLDKLTLYWSREDFDNSKNAGFLVLDEGRVLVRLGAETKEIDPETDTSLQEEIRKLILTVMRDYKYLLVREGV